MKTISILTFLFAAFVGFSQSLPESFESSITTSNFIDFDGGVATVLPNPQSSGINTSATVGRIVRNGGQIWAGSKYILSANLDFSTLSTISMKVYTTAPIGTTVKFKLEGVGQTEVDALTTATGAWQTLTWDFTGTPTNYNTIVLMFDFGNVGNGSANSTFYFDDIAQSAPVLSQINLPVTFENAGTNYTMTDFGGNASTMLPDPTNGANTVMQVIKGGGAQTWAGTTIGTNSGFASVIPLTLSNSTLTVKVWSPTAGTPIRLKVENSMNNTQTCETETNTTLAGAWETLVFNFASEAPGTATLNFGITNGWTFNMASIFFNFGTDGATAGAQTYYFDDVMFGGSVSLSQIDLPVTFESATVDYTMTDFGGNASLMMADPTNGANTVMQVIKGGGAQLWAGTTIGTNTGFATVIPLTLTDSKMSVKVWSPTAGTPIRLKVENSTNNTQTCETETSTTLAGAWETMEFDFMNEAAGTAVLNPALQFNMASIFFNFGTDGATAGAQTYYFDDVMFGIPVAPLDQIDLPVTFELATTDYTMTDFGGNGSTMMADPTNGANTVMQVIKSGGAQLWAGTTIGTNSGFATVIPLTLADSKMTVKVWSPTAGTPIRLKVENSSNNTETCETETSTTLAGAWEILEFDFNNEAAGTAVLNPALQFNMASIFFNFGTDGATAGEQTYYFDDVMFGAAPNPLAQIDLPVTFEEATVNYTMSDFGGNGATMVVDPVDPTNTAMQVMKSGTAETWAGTTIGTSAGFATNIPFTSTESFMSVRVWSPTAGTPIRLKVEDSNDNTHTCETEVNTTIAGGWETLVFNFANSAAGTPTLADGLTNAWTYNLASIFFNFGTNGATAGAQTYYFDDVLFGDPFAGTEELENTEMSVFPNPTNNVWNIVSEKSTITAVKIYSIQGALVFESTANQSIMKIDATSFSSGIYVAHVSTTDGTRIIRMARN